MANKKLPKQIYVVLRKEGTDVPFMLADDQWEFFEDGEFFGVYELKATAKKRTEHRLIPVPMKAGA